MKTNSIEPLESRIAPAAVAIDATHHLATWTDFDGDLVTLKYSGAAAPTFGKTDSGAGLLVDKITLAASGDYTVSVKAAAGGDGHVDLGRIDAEPYELTKWISPAATIAEFDAGHVDKFVSGTLGAVPYTKFNSTGGDGVSKIGVSGNIISSFTVRGDVASTELLIEAVNSVGTFTVTGSLRGDAPGLATASGSVEITAPNVGTILVGGSIIGGDTSGDGALVVNAGAVLKAVVLGSVIGGSAFDTAHFVVNQCKSAMIGGDVIGGSGELSGRADFKTTGKIIIGGSVIGGTEGDSGVVAAISVVNLAIKGSIIGGANTAAVNNNATGAVIVGNDLKTFLLGGDLVAGSFASGQKLSYNGAVIVGGNLGSATIKGSIIGHDGCQAIVMAGGAQPATPGDCEAIGKLIVGGSVSYGYVAAGQLLDTVSGLSERIGNAENPDAGIGSVRVGGDWFHSSLNAGINDASTNGVQSTDTRFMGDAARQAVIGPVVIKGYVLDNPGAIGVSGFAAEKIASLTAHGIKLFKSGDPAKSLDSHGYVDVAEI
jgi:hypothetical protein